ncbi:MAG: CoA transferase [Deltaproteobacteria bacterium]|nr:CoA transferase [Deltaproteobacteria bacterium]
MYGLEGYRIIDFGTAWAGPMSTQLLADMGAEVIKVETQGRLDGLRMGRPIVGDDIAGGDEGKWPNLQPAFHALNRNKLSITVDIKTEEGLALIRDLIKISDVVSDNFSPGVMDRAGLGYDDLVKIKPDIICVSLSGVGQYGPLRDATLYANTIMALSGLSSLIGYKDEPLLGMSAVAYGDANASIHAAFIIQAALYHRKMTGEGQRIDLAEAQMGSSLMGEALMDYFMNGRVAKPQGNRHPYMAPHNNYPCEGEDKWVSIAVKTDEEWQGFCEAIGNPAWCRDRKFADAKSRWENQEELDRRISEWTIGQENNDVMELLQAAGVAAVSCLNTEDQYFDPHFNERQSHIEIEHPLVGVESLYGIPWRLSETPGDIHRPAPSIGEHNDYVFGELLGKAKTEIERLVKAKVIY